jgi:hypothetical protein
MSRLEIWMESQEQYSRRNSLKLHNIQVLVDERRRIVHPVDIDKLILQVCSTKTWFRYEHTWHWEISVIGKVTNGKSHVTFKFLSYKMRNSVYTNKKAPNGDPRGIFFISENLTKYRTELVKKLSQLKYS